MIPFKAPRGDVQVAFEALAGHEGWQIDFADFPLPETDIVALVFDDTPVSSPQEALDKTGPLAGAVVAALAYRQRGRGRAIGALLDLGPGRGVHGITGPGYPRVTNLPFVPEANEIITILTAFNEHPQGIVFAQLFAEACRDPNAGAAVSRLWAILEALSDRFPGRAHEQVVGLLGQLTIGNPAIGDNLLTRHAYAVRNKFMHEGRVDPRAADLREDFTELVWFVLRLSGFRPIEPMANA